MPFSIFFLIDIGASAQFYQMAWRGLDLETYLVGTLIPSLMTEISLSMGVSSMTCVSAMHMCKLSYQFWEFHGLVALHGVVQSVGKCMIQAIQGAAG